MLNDVLDFIIMIIFLIILFGLLIFVLFIAIKYQLLLDKKKEEFIRILEDMEDDNGISAINHYLHIKVSFKELFGAKKND